MMDFIVFIHELLVTICLYNIYMLLIRIYRLPNQSIYIPFKILNETYIL